MTSVQLQHKVNVYVLLMGTGMSDTFGGFINRCTCNTRQNPRNELIGRPISSVLPVEAWIAN